MTTSLTRVDVGNVSDVPGRVLMNSSATLAEATTAGFINPYLASSSVQLAPTDFVFASLSDAMAMLTPSFSEGVITFVDITTPGGVITGGASLGGTDAIYAGVSGHNLTFKGLTAGANIGLTPSGTDVTVAATGLVTLAGASTMSSGSQIILDKGTGTEASNAVTINKQSGVITSSSLTVAAGDTYVIALTDSEIATTSVVMLQWLGGTNANPNFTMSCVVTLHTATITITNNDPTAAISGTVLIGFVVL